jgi:phospholipid-binding lipoprotein MlaA
MDGVNNFLQGKPGQGANDVGRVLINTTIGIGGTFDVASEMGLDKAQSEDFGQTLGVWGVGEGAYLFWPVVGPRTVRDTVGLAVDGYTPIRSGHVDPVDVRNSLVGVTFVDVRASLLPTDKIVEQARSTSTLCTRCVPAAPSL